MSRQNKWGYSPALDQIRFFAALMVFLAHFRPWPAVEMDLGPIEWILQLWAVNGASGVSVFLVLTGFLFGMIYEGGNKPVPYVPFLTKRLLRIGPMYLLIMVLLMTQLRGEWSFDHLMQFLTFQVNTGDPTSGFGAQHYPVGVIWTIGVEFQFYLIFPLLMAAVRPSNWQRIGGIILVFIALRLILGLGSWGAAGYYPSYHTLLGRMDQFLLGLVAASLFLQYGHKLSKLVAAVCLFVMVAVLTTWFAHFHPMKYPMNMVSFTVEGVVFAAIIVSFYVLGAIPTKVGSAITLGGKASYSFYLLHVLVGKTILDTDMFDVPDLGGGYWLQVFCFAFVPAMALSLLTYQVIEKPFMAIGALPSRALKSSAAP